MKAKNILPLLAVLSMYLIAWSQTTRPSGDSGVQIPTFSVAVKLSTEAQSRLRDLKESILVIAYFDGDGEGEPGVDTSPMRAVVLGSDKREVNANLIAEFKGAKASSSAWKRLSDKNYFVTINTVSARKVVADNILWCDNPEKRIEAIKGKTIDVRCELISERRF